MCIRNVAICLLTVAAVASAFVSPRRQSYLLGGLHNAEFDCPAAKTIFVTGGTGMVGSRFVCDALKADPTLTCVCLVRGESAAQRLEAKMKEWKSWSEDTRDRIVVVKGDVTKPNLGMSDCDNDYWVKHSDAVVHFAADIRLTRGDKSADLNSQACKEIFEFTSRGAKNPSLHFTSSIASCALLQSEYADEIMDHPIESAFAGGYGEQKWHAERYLAEKAAESPTPVSIYRIPFVINQDGKQPLSVPDLLFQIAAFTGTVPESASYVPMHSLKTISRCLVINVLRTIELSGDYLQGTGADIEVYHLADTRLLTWEKQVEQLNSAGLCATIVQWEEYKQHLVAASKVQRYAGKLCRALPVIEAIVKSNFTTLSTSKTQRLCLEAGFDLADANLSTQELGRSIALSVHPVLDVMYPTTKAMN
jgi:thioester reductase-like protein